MVLMNGVSSLLRIEMMLCSDSRLPTALLLMRVFVGAAMPPSCVWLEFAQADQLGRICDRGSPALPEPLAHLPGLFSVAVAGRSHGRSGLDTRRCRLRGGVRRHRVGDGRSLGLGS